MTNSQIKKIGSLVKQSKNVLPFLTSIDPEIYGKVGDSPEIYSIVNATEAAGQIISFSGQPAGHDLLQPVNGAELLALLNAPYDVQDNLVKVYSGNITLPGPYGSVGASV